MFHEPSCCSLILRSNGAIFKYSNYGLIDLHLFLNIIALTAFFEISSYCIQMCFWSPSSSKYTVLSEWLNERIIYDLSFFYFHKLSFLKKLAHFPIIPITLLILEFVISMYFLKTNDNQYKHCFVQVFDPSRNVNSLFAFFNSTEIAKE